MSPIRIYYDIISELKIVIMQHFKVKYKNSLSNPNSLYYKRHNGILTKIVTCKSEKEIYKLDNNSKNIISIEKI